MWLLIKLKTILGQHRSGASQMRLGFNKILFLAGTMEIWVTSMKVARERSRKH